MSDTILSDWQEVAESASSVTTAELDSKIKAYKEAKDFYDEKKRESNAAHAEMESAKAELLDILNQAGKDKYICEGVGTVSISRRPVVRVPKDIEDKKLFFNYLKERGLDVELTTVNHQTLNSFYKEELEAYSGEGVFEVPGIREVESMEVLSLRKSK